MSVQSSTIILIIFTIFGFVNTALSNNYRIVNGSNGKIRDFPCLASITLLNEHVCGGTILNANTILTAAHCLISSKKYYEVRLGSSFHHGSQKIKIARIISHEQYDRVTHANDIGLLKLAKNIKFGTDVAMAKLPQANSDVSADVTGVIVGWGSLRYNAPESKQLQHAEVSVVDRCVCKEFYKQYGNVTQRHICAGKKGVGTCEGDSGGPLLVNGETVGIVSVGMDKCCECGPTIFTRVSCFIDWIRQHA